MYRLSQLVLHIEKEVEMIQISLTQRKKLSISYEAPEFNTGVEIDPLSQNEMIGYLWVWRSRLVGCVIEGMCQVVGDEVAAL